MRRMALPILNKGVFSVALSQFGNTFAMNFIAVFMPFYILKISPFGPKETMLWTGLIMGAPSLMAALCLGNGVFSFTLIRMLQTGVIAAVFPMILSVFASAGRGETTGFLKSARFAGNAVEPFLAASVVASSSLPTLYLLISGLTLVTLAAFLRATREISLLPPERSF